jgi:hypothetical protein
MTHVQNRCKRGLAAVLVASGMLATAGAAMGAGRDYRPATHAEANAMRHAKVVPPGGLSEYIISTRNTRYGAWCTNVPEAGFEAEIYKRPSAHSLRFQLVTGGSGIRYISPEVTALFQDCVHWAAHHIPRLH